MNKKKISRSMNPNVYEEWNKANEDKGRKKAPIGIRETCAILFSILETILSCPLSIKVP